MTRDNESCQCYIIGQVNKWGQLHGFGRKINREYPYIQEGQWCNGNLSGYGRHFDDRLSYIGDCKDGEFHGFGTCIWIDGKTYVGALENGMFHGQGTFTNRHGKIFEGEFKEHTFNGDDAEQL